MMDDYVDVYREVCRLAEALEPDDDGDGQCFDCRFYDDDKLPTCLLKGRYTNGRWHCSDFEEGWE